MRRFTGVWIQPMVTLVTLHCTLAVFVWTWILCQVSVTTALRRSPIRLDGRFVIKDYEIVYPMYIGSGETAVRADFDQGYHPRQGRRRRRQRRNARARTTGFPNFQSTSQLNISGLGQNFIVKLESNEDLLAPGFQVYFRGNGSVLSRTWPHNTDSERMPQGRRGERQLPIGGECLYRGNIVSHPSARAAFSMCRGQMFGMLMTREDDFVIEPVPSRQRIRTPSSRHAAPHLMYRASDLRQRDRRYEGLKASLHEPARGHRTAGLEWWFDRRRRKRSAYKLSRGLTAELLVVADKSMYYAHKADDVIMYILSIMNIVSQLYKESSLGTTIKITLVGLVIMQTDEPKLTINHHAGQTLQNFCQWQAGVTGAYGKHDHAVLITSLDICSHKNQPCDTLGYAPIEGMCDSTRSCSINEDTGLATGYTVAHEMGHNLGMYHDGGKDMCPHATGTIMAPKLTVGGEGEIFKWSSCSRNYLIKFLHTQQAKCLWKNSLQVSRLRFPQKLPGEIYSVNQQCAWLFGKGSTRCTYEIGKNMCKHLWCESEGHLCQTKYLPAADGTTCDTGKWCVQGRCVLSGRSVQDSTVGMVNGAWSEWGAWSDCSRSCGGGVRQRERRCDNPRPMYGGEPCEGISRSYRVCHTQECENREEEFRADQCRRYERQPFHGSYYKWRPYNTITQVNDQCKLYCQALGYDFITALSNQVQDGTPCSPHSTDVCVEGSCKSYGCDMIIDSDAKEDNCGVCRGDNSTCRVVKGEFRLQPRLRVYFPITVIPKQARHIHIEEKSVSHNYLAIRDIYGNYYLNGNKNVEVPGIYILGGARFEYRRSQNKQESLFSIGPLKQDIVLEVLVIGRNPGILYDYTLPTQRSPLPENYDTPAPSHNQNDRPRPPNKNYDPPRRYHPNHYDFMPPRTTPPRHYYRWRTVKDNCSEPCGGGQLNQQAECWMDGRYHVNPALCDPQTRPYEGKIGCNSQHCEPRWVSYEWRACSRSCGGGKQLRKIRCRQRLSQKVDRRVDKRLCARHPKPSRRQWCNTEDCPPAWTLGKWTKCSVTCGRGVQSRNQTCQKQTLYGHTLLPDSACHHLSRHAPTHRTCRLAECPADYQWVVSSWSKCSTTCGLGVKTRALRCSYVANGDRGRHSVDSHYCARLPQPQHIPLQEVCTNRACSPQHWHTSAWTKCSVSCGSGRRTRSVYCRDMRTGRHSGGCDWRSKPDDTESCDGGHCPLAVPYHCVDQFSWCGLVPKHNVCRHNFYGTRCCHSCRSRRSLGR